MSLLESSPARLAVDHAVMGSLASPAPNPRAGVESVKAARRAGTFTTRHGAGGYRDGCRCYVCSDANTLRVKRYRVKRARRGPLMTDADVTTRQLQALHTATRSWMRVGAMLGVSGQAVWKMAHRRHVRVETAAKVDALWRDLCGPVCRDTRRWPSQPIYDAVIARYGSLNASPWRRDMTRIHAKGHVSTETAETWAERLGLLPYEIWDDWAAYGLEEAV